MSTKINKLEIENVKRVKAVAMEPTSTGLTVIGGDNGQGKTSVLDAIAWALGGEKYRPSMAQREGSALPPSLKVTLSNGIIVERTGKNSALKVTDPSGKKAGQALLDSFVEKLALDLPKFMEASGKEKASTLLQIIGVEKELAVLDKEEQEIYQERLYVGRTADQKRKFAAEQDYYPDMPSEPVSPSDLIRQQQEILARNGENQRKRLLAAELEKKVDRLSEQVSEAYGKAAEWERKAKELEQEYNAACEDKETAFRTCEELQDESTAELEENIAQIDEINRKVRANLDKEKAEEDAKQYEHQYQELTGQIEGIREKRRSLLEGARLPLEGLSVQDGELTYNGQKWDNMSSSEQMIDEQIHRLNDSFTKNSLVQIAFVVVAMVTLFNISAIIHRREKQIEREKILAEESSRAKTSFLSNMSHEIRTPMNAIIGLDNIALKDPDLSPRTREQLEKIGSSAKHLLGLINDILDMSRIESGRMALKEEEFSFRVFLDQINVIINGQCADKGLHYDCRIIGHVNDYYIGDDMKLKQVLINILGNAVKFTPEGGSVSLTVEQATRFDDYCMMRFVIKDTGIGMSKEYIPKIFDAFSQENSGAANRYGSTGLGMAITKNLVEMMNGDIAVESEKGFGTTFTVTVTLKSSSRTVSQADTVTLPKGLRVMVVDDNEVELEHAQLILRDIGIASDASLSAEDALKRIREKWDAGMPYQFLMTDYRMPGMTGLELTRAIREFDGGKTSVILLTGYNWDDLRDEVEALGIVGVMSKPLFTDNVMRQLHTILLNTGDIQPVEVEAEPETAVAEDEVSLEGLCVLMAEDIDLNAEILTDLLDMEGVKAERAENGQAAVDMFLDHDIGYYNAILMDVRMPVMDGLEATAAIRALERPDAQQIPIIAMTANAFDEDVQRSLQAGMNAHLSKPIEPDRLYETLHRLAVKSDQ